MYCQPAFAARFSRAAPLTALLLGVVSAQAFPVPSSGYEEEMSFLNATAQTVATTPHAALSSYASSVPWASGLNQVQFNNEPDPWVWAESYGRPDNLDVNIMGAAYGRMIYTITLSGDANSAIPVSFLGRARVQAAPDGAATWSKVVSDATFMLVNSNFAWAGVDLNARQGYGQQDAITATGTGADVSRIERTGNTESGYFNGTLLFPTDTNGNAVGYVVLAANTQFGSGGGTADSYGVAYVDPKLFIDPVWLDQHPQTTLMITPGVGNEVSPVPEAPTSLVLVSGLALFCLRQRRARRSRPD
jgi:hypothetical protein